jgi:hypothetical protein
VELGREIAIDRVDLECDRRLDRSAYTTMGKGTHRLVPVDHLVGGQPSRTYELSQ